MWPDPSGFPYRREAAILSYNVNVYRPRATAPSRTRLSHTLLFPAELNLGGDDSFPGSWKVVLTYKRRESFHKSWRLCCYSRVLLLRIYMRTSCVVPARPHSHPDFSLHQHLRKRHTTPRNSTSDCKKHRRQWNQSSFHGCTDYSEGRSTITERRTKETKEHDSSIISIWGEDLTKRTAPTTTSVNITAN